MNHHNYQSLTKIFDAYLAEHQPKGMPDTLYEPMRYINDMGGKRIRPILLLMGYNLWHEDIAPGLPAALAVEFFHNFSLMHDDIMDEAPLRRGKESVHMHYNRNTAMLSGDALLIKCFELLIALDQQYHPPSSVSHIMANISLEICEGQQMDMDFEKLDSPSEEAYIEMIRKKTGCLIGACLKIGAILAGASMEVADMLYGFGENMGISFQIQDDILDVFGEQQVTGKQHGGDILRGKKNFLYVRAFNSMTGEKQSEFISSYTKASTKSEIHSVILLYKNLYVEGYAKQIQQEYFDLAMNCLDNLSLETGFLKSFALDLMSRDH